MENRLQKLLSAAGVCSRRAAETYITAGRVTVNGETAVLGDKADPERDHIHLDGKPLRLACERVYLLLNKPQGYVTTLSDERGRRTVAALTENCGARVWPVGRLDLDSEGLILMTNDGEMTNLLLHPSHEVEKEYHVTVEGNLGAALPILRGPITLDGTRLHPAQVTELGGSTLSVTIHEGKNRQVRRMCTVAGLVVKRLKRVREGKLHLDGLSSGHWRPLTATELEWLESLR